MSSTNTTDLLPVWQALSSQQLKRVGLTLTDKQQQKVNKSLTRLNKALIAAGFEWPLCVSHRDAAPDDLDSKQAFESFLATYR